MALMIFRWIVAVPMSVLFFVVGFAVGALVLPRFGASVYVTMVWMVALGAILGAFTGIMIAPLRHRRFARLAFSLAPLLIIIGFAARDLRNPQTANSIAQPILEICGSIMGGTIVYNAFRSSAAKASA